MGKGYVESLGDVVRFSQFMEVAAEEMEKMIQLGRNQQDAVKGEYSRQETYLTDARNRAEERCQSKSAKRKEAANWAVVHVKALLDRIEDPHFHGMEQKYSEVCNENSVYSSIDTPKMLLEKLNNGVVGGAVIKRGDLVLFWWLFGCRLVYRRIKKRYQRQISLIPQVALLVFYFRSDIMNNNWAATFLLINLTG